MFWQLVGDSAGVKLIYTSCELPIAPAVEPSMPPERGIPSVSRSAVSRCS